MGWKLPGVGEAKYWAVAKRFGSAMKCHKLAAVLTWDNPFAHPIVRAFSLLQAKRKAPTSVPQRVGWGLKLSNEQLNPSAFRG